MPMRSHRLAGVWLSAAMALAPAMAQAQAYQCRLPARVSVPPVQQDGPARRVPITGYTAALSWSPEFCKGRERQARHAVQCSGRNGRFGLVMHGLWPDGRSGARGTWPQWCQTPRRLSSAEARRNMCMMPGARLVARQWTKHGACMTRRPETYFRITRIFWSALAKPDLDALSRQEGLRAGDIRQAFAAANNGLEPEHVGIVLNRRGWFREARICLDRRFRPAPCDRRRFGAADNAAAKIWRGL